MYVFCKPCEYGSVRAIKRVCVADTVRYYLVLQSGKEVAVKGDSIYESLVEYKNAKIA